MIGTLNAAKMTLLGTINILLVISMGMSLTYFSTDG